HYRADATAQTARPPSSSESWGKSETSGRTRLGFRYITIRVGKTSVLSRYISICDRVSGVHEGTMNQRETALASLWDRTYRAAVTSDSSVLLDEMALDDAQRLIAAVDPETDLPAARALGWFCWLRYLALSGHDAERELYAALSLLKPVFERNPYAVP